MSDDITRWVCVTMKTNSRSTVSQQLRKAIAASRQSLRAIARETGLDIGVLSRFVRQERGISDETLSVLCKHLGLELRSIRRQTKDDNS